MKSAAMATRAPSKRDPSRLAEPVAVIGAGPYGLAAAAHLRAASVETLCFGEPLEFWRHNMPAGMMLRSRRRSSHIADPHHELTIDRYEQAEGKAVHSPHLLLKEFIDYASWFQRDAAPGLDRRKVAMVTRSDGGFRLRLADGEELSAARVVVAAGLAPFPARPAPFASLPHPLVSHSSEHADLAVFADRRVLVVGAGQSALESAALLSECGASVTLLIRATSIRWLAGDSRGGPRGSAHRWSPPTDVGGGLSGWTAAAPDVFRRVPQALQPSISYRCIRAAGAAWLRPRLERVEIAYGRYVTSASEQDRGVRVVLNDGSERVADHVLLGTGYEIDITRYPFLAPELAEGIELASGYPLLGPGLESSVPGLHFLGAPAALSFGPVMRFVVGTQYAAPALARRVLGQRQPRIRFSF
jgi:FAD-dependent urate hydroxylase